MIIDSTELRRVRELLAVASTTESGQPILHMITTFRKSANLVVRVFVITMPNIVCVDISTEVAQILGVRYSQAHRGVPVNTLYDNAHVKIMNALGHAVYGADVRDPLHYRSV